MDILFDKEVLEFFNGYLFKIFRYNYFIDIII